MSLSMDNTIDDHVNEVTSLVEEVLAHYVWGGSTSHL